MVCDAYSDMRMAHALTGVLEAVGAEHALAVMPTRRFDRKNELPGSIEAALERVDCMIGLTGACGAPTYSAATKRLLDTKRIRVMSMVMRTMDIFTQGGALADYRALADEGETLAARWRQAEQVRLTSAAGTDLHAQVAGELVIVECGYATEPGQEAAFSDGEVSQMPREGSASGTLVIDGPIAHVGVPPEPVTLTVERGRVVDVSGGGRIGTELARVVAEIDDADNIAEIGIGLNPACRHLGEFEEEKKARGNVHVALGSNVFYGGTVDCAVHMDMVVYAPTVEFDDEVIVDAGRVVRSG